MSIKILLADDSITIQKVISITLSAEDYDLTVVGDGATAIEKIKILKPDVVLADIAMPNKNGYEVCEFVKNDPTMSKTTVMLLAGTFEPLNRAEAQRVKADDNIVKPFGSQEFLDKVKALVMKATAPEQSAVPEVPEEKPEITADTWKSGEFLGGSESDEAIAAAAEPDLSFLDSAFDSFGGDLGGEDPMAAPKPAAAAPPPPPPPPPAPPVPPPAQQQFAPPPAPPAPPQQQWAPPPAPQAPPVQQQWAPPPTPPQPQPQPQQRVAPPPPPPPAPPQAAAPTFDFAEFQIEGEKKEKPKAAPPPPPPPPPPAPPVQQQWAPPPPPPPAAPSMDFPSADDDRWGAPPPPPQQAAPPPAPPVQQQWAPPPAPSAPAPVDFPSADDARWGAPPPPQQAAPPPPPAPPVQQQWAPPPLPPAAPSPAAPAVERIAAKTEEKMMSGGLPPDITSIMSKEQIEEIIRKTAREIIEEIAWEVVPELAEDIVLNEMSKIRDLFSKVKQK